MLLSVDATILTVDNLESADQRVARGPFLHVSPSPNGKFLALLTFSGLLWVVSTDFQRELVVLDTATVGAEGPVNQVEWCGNDAVLVTWNDLASLILPSRDNLAGETLRFGLSLSPTSMADMISIAISILVLPLSSQRPMVPVLQGRTFATSSRKCLVSLFGSTFSQVNLDMLRTVSSVSIFRPGSTSSSAILFAAWESFVQRSPKADENIRSIRSDLAAAVNECIDAAGHEWDPYWQRKLLSASIMLEIGPSVTN